MQTVGNKIVLITGATSGIGLACAEQFAAAGAHLIITGRRKERLVEIAKRLQQVHSIDVLPMVFDVSKREEVRAAFQQLSIRWQAIAILVNNAGLSLKLDKLQEGDESDWDKMIDTNVKGLLYVTRRVLPLMLQHNCGHIVNVASLAAYQVYPGGAVYCATKFAVHALTQGIKMDLHGTPLRVSEISPGMVQTEFSEVRFSGDKQRAAAVYAGMQPLTAEDIADTILYCVTRPLHVNIQSIVLTPVAQSAATLVHRSEK